MCGEIDSEMSGQSIFAAGELTSVSQLFTREHKPFIKATLEDISGSIEVMVWPRVFEETRELWEEGNILSIEGKVRVRDDTLQLSCDLASIYQPPAAKIETEPDLESVNTPESDPAPVSVVTFETKPEALPLEKRKLIISITQTSDKDKDINCLNQIYDLLGEFPGEDEVSLLLNIEDRVVNLKLTNKKVDYCPEIQQRLMELVGENGLRLVSNQNSK
jgi:DNA polymerase-3 subunit alpha